MVSRKSIFRMFSFLLIVIFLLTGILPAQSESLASPLYVSGDFAWAKRLGGTEDDFGRSIAIDSNGNIYTTGHFAGIADFDPGAITFNLSSPGGSDIFVTKLDSNGNFIWAKRMGGTSDDEGRGIAVDTSGNVYTTGYFKGTADFDPGAGTVNLTSAGGDDIFVSKLNSNGDFVWAKRMGGTSFDAGLSIGVNSSGVHTTGYFDGTADFDPSASTAKLTSAGGDDIFVSKLNSNGDFVWARRMGGIGQDAGMSIGLNSSGNVHVTGYYLGTVDFDPGAGTVNLTSAGNSRDIFVSKLSSSGSFLRAKSMGGTDFDEGTGIAVDASGNIYTTGYFYGSADFNPGVGIANLASAGADDIFVSKWDPSGNYVWARRMGGTGFDDGYGITVDSLGNVYTSGSFTGTADFNPGIGTANLISAGLYDIFVSKLDNNGNFVWAKRMGGTDSDAGLSIDLDSSGNIYTVGGFEGTADFNPGASTNNLTSAGLTDIFVSKLENDVTLPTVSSIIRAGANPTAAASVNFTVTFSESVSGVNISAPFNDFVLSATGVTGAVITGVSGSGATRTVTVDTGTGSGTIRLDVVDDDSIVDVDNNPLGGVGMGNGDYTTGETYNIMEEQILNGGFNTYIGTSKVPTSWKAVNFSTSDGKTTTVKKEGIASVRITGTGVSKTLSQTLNISGSSGDAFTFSFWVKGSSIPATGICRGQVLLYNGSTLKQTKTLNCSAGTYGFQKKTITFNASAAYTKVVIKFTYSKASGQVWFDAVSLIK